MDLQKHLLENYIDGWKSCEKQRVLQTLSFDCLIIESHGPTYRGRKRVEQWFTKWHQMGNQIKEWKITSFYTFENLNFCEWFFSYEGKNISESFDGITIAKTRDNQITYLREYRSTSFPYPWDLNQVD